VRRLALALAGLALGGCGLAVGAAPTGVTLLVTSEFGAHVLQRESGLHAHEGETLASLESRLHASPESEAQAGSQVLYVNGVQAAKGAKLTRLYPGDHVWVDTHDVSQAPSTPAVIVGAFPEPFLNGIEGKRLPVRVECTSVSGEACTRVTASLRRVEVPAAITAVGSGGAPETLRVIVGPWGRIDGDIEARRIAQGPRTSGVYARFSTSARELTLLDPAGRAVRTLAGAAGLIAATQGSKEAPVWVVTGTDEAGVQIAARSFDGPALEGHFALALEAAGEVALPILDGASG
jgi:hypothetical protein